MNFDRIFSKIPSVRYFVKIIRTLIPRCCFNSRFVLIVSVIYLIILTPLYLFSLHKVKMAAEEVKEEKSEDILPLVKVFKVERDDFKETLEAMGTVKGTSEVKLKFEINGKIASFNFREGDDVTKGEIIVSLDAVDVMTRLRHAKSRLNSIKSRHAAAKEKLDVYRELYHMGAIIKTKINEMELNVQSMRSEVETAKSEVVLAQSQIDKTVVSAPANGVMGSRLVETGDFVTPNDIVGTFLEIKNVFVEMGVIEKNIEKIVLYQKVKVTVDAYPNEVFWGKIDNISKMVRGRTRTLPVKVIISNPKQKLYSGMFAECEIYLTEIKDSLIIPTASVIRLGEMDVVPLIKLLVEDITEEAGGSPELRASSELNLEETGERLGIVELRKILIGYSSASYTNIKDGLEPGDLVVMETQQPLRDDMRVKVIEVIKREKSD